MRCVAVPWCVFLIFSAVFLSDVLFSDVFFSGVILSDAFFPKVFLSDVTLSYVLLPYVSFSDVIRFHHLWCVLRYVLFHYVGLFISDVFLYCGLFPFLTRYRYTEFQYIKHHINLQITGPLIPLLFMVCNIFIKGDGSRHYPRYTYLYYYKNLQWWFSLISFQCRSIF